MRLPAESSLPSPARNKTMKLTYQETHGRLMELYSLWLDVSPDPARILYGYQETAEDVALKERYNLAQLWVLAEAGWTEEDYAEANLKDLHQYLDGLAGMPADPPYTVEFIHDDGPEPDTEEP